MREPVLIFYAPAISKPRLLLGEIVRLWWQAGQTERFLNAQVCLQAGREQWFSVKLGPQANTEMFIITGGGRMKICCKTVPKDSRSSSTVLSFCFSIWQAIPKFPCLLVKSLPKCWNSSDAKEDNIYNSRRIGRPKTVPINDLCVPNFGIWNLPSALLDPLGNITFRSVVCFSQPIRKEVSQQAWDGSLSGQGRLRMDQIQLGPRNI